MDYKVKFKLVIYFVLYFLIISAIEYGSKNWGEEFRKECCSCEIKEIK